MTDVEKALIARIGTRLRPQSGKGEGGQAVTAPDAPLPAPTPRALSPDAADHGDGK